MDEKKVFEDKCINISDVNLLKSKIRERFYELELKRRLVEESRVAVSKLNLEKHELIQRAEKAERQLSEVNIHLHVAIKAAHEAEAERSTARELLARQGAQLDSASKEREFLQQSNRSLQLALDEMKHELEDTKSKMKSQSHFLDLIKEKDSQNKTMLEILLREVEKFEQSQAKLKELSCTISQITKAVYYLLNHQKKQLSEIHSENTDLQQKNFSLTGQLEEAIKDKFTIEKNEKETDCFKVWQSVQKDMQCRLTENENEICHLQRSLNAALATSAKLQLKDMEMSNKIRDLEDELKKAKENFSCSKIDKDIQTDFIITLEDYDKESSKVTE